MKRRGEEERRVASRERAMRADSTSRLPSHAQPRSSVSQFEGSTGTRVKVDCSST